MDHESLFRRLAGDIEPSRSQKDRVRAVLKRRIDAPSLLVKAKLELTPEPLRQSALWRRVLSRIESAAVRSLFDRIRTLLDPSLSSRQSVKRTMLSRITPATASPLRHRPLRWIAAFVVVMLALQISPALFVAPPTIAESSVLLLPMQGRVDVSLHDLWEPVTAQAELNQAVALRTEADGQATILLHSNGNVRLAPQTTLALHDVSDHAAVVAAVNPTMILSGGTIWLQGLLPDSAPGFTVRTTQGEISVHGGSVSVSVTPDRTHVEVWDRNATVTQGTFSETVVAGEMVDVGNHGISSIQNVPADAYKGTWVAQNLQRDAVHQREMAQMQEEWHAAQAGILPTSPLYPVKRVAEAVDVMLTLDPQARLQKQIDQANTRLNEAAAMLAAGDTGAAVPLNEYTQTLLAAAAGSGSDASAKQLIQQSLAQNTAQLSAALPDDTAYLLKKTVLEANLRIHDGVTPQDITGTLLVDTLDALHQAVQSGSGTQVAVTLQSLSSYLPALQSGSTLAPEVKKEAISLISDVTDTARQTSSSGADLINRTVAQTLSPYLPLQPVEAPQRVPVVVAELPSLTDAELDAAVQQSLHRIFDVYDMPQSQENQLRVEMKKFEDSPDEGRYLRRLYDAMPIGSSMRELVRHQIQVLRETQIMLKLQQETGTGEAM